MYFIILSLTDGQQVTLSPRDVTVEQGQYAEFLCNYDCTIHNTYTVFWAVGFLPGSSRIFSRARTSSFIEETGLYVEASRVISCEGSEGTVIETLRINGSSAEEFNKTAVQCVAYSKNPSAQHELYSQFSIMLINGKYVHS